MSTIEIPESWRQGPQGSLCIDKHEHPRSEDSSLCHTPVIPALSKLSCVSGSWIVHLGAAQSL